MPVRPFGNGGGTFDFSSIGDGSARASDDCQLDGVVSNVEKGKRRPTGLTSFSATRSDGRTEAITGKGNIIDSAAFESIPSLGVTRCEATRGERSMDRADSNRRPESASPSLSSRNGSGNPGARSIVGS